jgi:hypothetical protein
MPEKALLNDINPHTMNFIAAYRVAGDAVTVLRVLHGAAAMAAKTMMTRMTSRHFSF